MSNVRFVIAVALIYLGYALFWSGKLQLFTSGHGLSFFQALTATGDFRSYAPEGTQDNTFTIGNQTGNTPQTGAAPVPTTAGNALNV